MYVWLSVVCRDPVETKGVEWGGVRGSVGATEPARLNFTTFSFRRVGVYYETEGKRVWHFEPAASWSVVEVTQGCTPCSGATRVKGVTRTAPSVL